MRIDICGGIASGKTTLVTALRNRGFDTYYERFADNPFFDKFYADPKGYAFETELTYLLQHFSAIRVAPTSGKTAFDFSFALDLSYACITLSPSDQEAFEYLLDLILGKLPRPDIIVHLECASDVELARIRERGRLAEQQISRPYLERLGRAIDDVLTSHRFKSIPLVRIDSQHVDFRPGGNELSSVLDMIDEYGR